MSNNIALDEFATEEQGEKTFDFLGTLRRRKWLILLGTICGAGLGYLTYLKAEPVFQSSARLLISQVDNNNLPVKGAELDQTPIETEVYLIQSPKIVDAAVDVAKLNLDSQAIIGGLSVSAVGSAKSFRNLNLIDLKFKGSDPDECRNVLQAVIEQYQLFLKDKKEDSTQTVINLITDLKLNVMSKLEKQQEEYRSFREKMPLISTTGGNGDNLHYQRLSEVESQRTSLVIQKRMLVAQYESLTAALDAGGSREAMMLLMDHQLVDNQIKQQTIAQKDQLLEEEPIDPLIEFQKRYQARVAETLLPMLVEEKQMESELGAAHPKLKALRQRIAYTRTLLKSMERDEKEQVIKQKELMAEKVRKRNEQIKELNKDAPVEKTVEQKDFILVYLESMRARIKQFEEQERKLDELFKSEEEQARGLNQLALQHEDLRSNVEQKQRLLDALVERLEEVSLVQDYGGRFAEVIHRPGRGQQVENMTRIMVIASILGSLAGLVLACLVEIADKSFRSPDDLMTELGLPLIGHIPFMEISKKLEAESTSAIDQTMCTFHKPKSRLAEAYRAVRTALFFSTSGNEHKVIQVTSPTSGDGKSTLAANLSISIAKSGKRVLLMEADYRRPRVHKVFGLENTVGVTNILLGNSELVDGLQETECEGLSVLTCGPRPHNPAELVTSPAFESLLTLLRDKFDFVIVDSPPMLAVTDPSAVAPRVDGVIMTFRLSKRARSLAKQSVDLLRKLGGNVLGIVVNGVDEMDGYGYGSYRYDNYNYGYRSYRYGSKYDYGVDYEDTHGNEYYEEEEEGSLVQ